MWLPKKTNKDGSPGDGLEDAICLYARFCASYRGAKGDDLSLLQDGTR